MINNIITIECINNGGLKDDLTVGKQYQVLDYDDSWYRFINDEGIPDGYQKHLFKIVDQKVKKDKEYDFRTVISNIRPNEEYNCKGFKVKCLKDNTIEMIAPSSNIIGFCESDLFVKVEPKPVSFIEAWKSLDEGKTIESTYTLDRYKIIDGLIKIQHQGGEFEKCGNIATTEIGNSWIVLD